MVCLSLRFPSCPAVWRTVKPESVSYTHLDVYKRQAQDGTVQVGTVQVGTVQVGTVQVGIAKVGIAQVGIAQVGFFPFWFSI